MEIVDSGVIFRNPLPGHRVINAIYPLILPLPDGELLCIVRVCSALYSRDGVLEIFRSSDGGTTWERQGPVRDRSWDTVHYSDFLGTITALRDGSLLLRCDRLDMTDPDVLAFNETTGGWMPWELCVCRSTDAGRTWSDPATMNIRHHFGEEVEPVPSGRMIELNDGAWFLCVETWKTHDNDGPFNLDSHALFSRDEGVTWDDKVEVAVGAPDNLSFSHGFPIELDDGRLFASFWAAEPQLQSYYGLYTTTSTDATARTWTPPRKTGIPGQTSCAAELGDGRMMMVYSHRDDPDQPGVKVVRSDDGGETWDLDNPLVIWDAYGKEALGVARTSTYPSSHDTIAYGAPRIVRLNADEAMACFWCTQGSDTHCRWCRVRW